MLHYAGLYGQAKFDTIVDKGIYKSYFNKGIKQPIAVTYTLFKGGGKASRDNDHFKGDHFTLHDKDYKGSGYDRGHLVPAEDFAYSDSLQALTFSYYNCVPQHPKLNRGKWKKLEAKVRRLSRLDTLVVICYMEFDHANKHHVNIPVICYKVVFDSQKRTVLAVGFANDASGKEYEVNERILAIIQQFETH